MEKICGIHNFLNILTTYWYMKFISDTTELLNNDRCFYIWYGLCHVIEHIYIPNLSIYIICEHIIRLLIKHTIIFDSSSA